MTNWEEIEFRAPREPIQYDEGIFPNPHLSSIKLNPNIKVDDCQRILDLLNGKRKPAIIQRERSPDIVLREMPKMSSPPLNFAKPSNRASPKSITKPPMPMTENNRFNTFAPSSLTNNNNKPRTVHASMSSINMENRTFQALYGRYKPYKKNKEWTYDGFVQITSNGLFLHDQTGKKIGRADKSKESQELPKVFNEGTRIVISSYECELSEEISTHAFESGEFFAPDS